MTPRVRAVPLAAGALLALASAAPARALASSSADELVRQARAHEASGEDDVAVRRYMDALTIEPTHEGAWLGLGALRVRMGETAEAERVYSSALARVPTLRAALEGRARARWALERHPEAETDLEAFATSDASLPAWRELAGWYGADGRSPAQLAVWRRILRLAVEREDAASEREARRMVRALLVLVDTADPASSPPWPDTTRRSLAAIARRGG
ncbi:MAG: tetratricopeptide repeat protein [Myxococcales bacterium]|nr:tetratricopeptide repeat protein [Myxococcales bacterium]